MTGEATENREVAKYERLAISGPGTVSFNERFAAAEPRSCRVYAGHGHEF